MASMNLPKVKLDNFESSNDSLVFTIKNINVSLINAIRRTVLSDIPCVVFRTMPYEKSMVNITKNTTRLNNEIIKQRLSCIPIYITDLSIPLEKYLVELDVKNDTNEIIYVTTKDFKIKDIESDKYLIDKEVHRIFPPNEITKEHILITRLRPQLSDDIHGETLTLNAKMTITNAKEDSGFNVVSTCSYEFLKDVPRIQTEWNKKEKELRENGLNDEEISFEKENWMLHDAKRIYLDDQFKFIIETIGVFDNKTLVSKSCDIINSKIQYIIDECDSETLKILDGETMMNSFNIILENEDYTIGKCIEYGLNELYYKQQQILTFVGFKKKHPHDTYSIINIAFKNDSLNKESVYPIIKLVCELIKDVFQDIKSQL
jgi:DNA-directed RNA polymerase subunit L